MKLYLSSYRIPTPEDLLGLMSKQPSQCRVALIPNAKDYKLPDERALSIDEVISDLTNIGFKIDLIDLRDYDVVSEFQDTLGNCDAIFVAGGNTFVLRSELRRTQLDQKIVELVRRGMVYCGESAGAIVAGTTLEGVEIADEPELADEHITDGLAMINSVIIPHADSPDFIEYINTMKKRYLSNPTAIYLNDNQALVVDDTSQKIVTAS